MSVSNTIARRPPPTGARFGPAGMATVAAVAGATALLLLRPSPALAALHSLPLLGLAYEQRAVHLLKGEQRGDAYLKLNPQGFVPMLEVGALRLTQSLGPSTAVVCLTRRGAHGGASILYETQRRGHPDGRPRLCA